MLPLILTSAILGQCYAPQRAANYGYRQQTYTQAYVQPTYAATQYQATAYFQADPGYFAASVAAYTKKQIADAAALQAQTDLVAKLAKLDETVGKLTVQFGQALTQPDPQPQPQQPYSAPLASPQAPQYATPQVPDKATPPVPGKSSYGSYPDAGYVAPPVPGKASASSGYGSSSPPPIGIGPPPGTGDSLAAEAMQRSRCVKCHTGNGASGGFTIFDDSGRLAPLNDAARKRIVEVVDTKYMPPKREGIRVSPADQIAIYGLLNAGPPVAGSPMAGSPRTGY